MRQIAIPLLLFASATTVSAAKPAPLVPACPESYRQPLFLSPVGEPFRVKSESDDPVRNWFDQVDRDHDGKVTMAEMLADADRYFALLDKDRSGELLPDEVHAYEDQVGEIRLYQRRPEPAAGERGTQDRTKRAPKPKRGVAAGDDGIQGAGRYAFLNIPNPIASADADFNRAVDLKEFRAAIAERFRDLDKTGQKALTVASLPKTPAQVQANAACLQRAKDKAKGDRR